MKYLFIHHNFPAQFHKMSERLAADPQNTVVFLSLFKRRKDLTAKNVQWLQISSKKHANLNAINSYEQSIVFAESQVQLRNKGFIPDIIHGHANFGTINFSKEIFPTARQTGFFEWYYKLETEQAIQKSANIAIPNLSPLHRQCNIITMGALEMVDAALSATEWQKAQFPIEYHNKIQTLHNGIDTEFFCPGSPTVLPEEFAQLQDKEIVTYMARSLEPHRGFVSFYRSIPQILAKRPNAHIVIVGDPKTSYSQQLSNGKSYLEAMQETVDVDTSRIHIFPTMPYEVYRSVLRRSTVHMYLTVPFTLSWSLLEAMSCGCTMVVSNTESTQEVIEDGQNAFFTDFYNSEEIAKTVCHALENHEKLDHIRTNARKTVLEKYDEKLLLPKYIDFLNGDRN